MPCLFAASDTLKFPEEYQTPIKQTLRSGVGAQELKPAPCPNGALFCEEATDYPK